MQRRRDGTWSEASRAVLDGVTAGLEAIRGPSGRESRAK